MLNKRLLILLSILVVLLAVCAMVYLPPSDYSAIGSLFAAVGGILAVIWFSASLYYQSRQLKEQREQFLVNFEQLREDNRRNSLIVARDILSRAEEKALKANPNLKSISDLMTVYMAFFELGDILKSTDPQTVLEQGKKWLTLKEGPAMFLMRGIKSAAETYFRAVGNNTIDYAREPEEFVFIYGPTLWKIPYFDEYQGVAHFMSEMMVLLEPGRKGALLAYQVAMLKTSPDPKIFKQEKIIEDIKQYKQKGRKLPAIVEQFMTEQSQE
jgi:hypothetical protein